MVRGLTAAATLWLIASSSSAQAQMKGLGAVEIAEAAKNHALDLRISQEPPGAARLPLAPNMLLRHELGRNAAVGVGFANMYERRRGGNLRAGDPPARSRKPAITFVLKF